MRGTPRHFSQFLVNCSRFIPESFHLMIRKMNLSLKQFSSFTGSTAAVGTINQSPWTTQSTSTSTAAHSSRNHFRFRTKQLPSPRGSIAVAGTVQPLLFREALCRITPADSLKQISSLFHWIDNYSKDESEPAFIERKVVQV